ncbi:Squalene/phytoene synthase-domain-containing protein [Phycomyces nitens]|nr:Squalene/phytoene synthase-domain-containing protein [Phycomyces nitens]
MMGVLWYISGPFLVRRWKVIGLSSGVSTTAAMLSIHNVPGQWETWSAIDWIALTLTIAMACNVLDHIDAIINMYPYLITTNPTILARMQSPTAIEYWYGVAKLVSHMPSETDLPLGPISDLETAIRLLGPASRSWKTMAALFPTNLRQELCLLYAFFRTADDLVDDAPTLEQSQANLVTLRSFLHDVFSSDTTKQVDTYFDDPTLPSSINWDYYRNLLPSEDVLSTFRSFARVSHYICPRAMFELTDAWELDLKNQPLKAQNDLLQYAALISGTFGELCTCVIMYKTGHGNWRSDMTARKDDVLSKARSTGQCLQLVNIARDVIADSINGRCYVPLQYMKQPQKNYSILKKARSPSKLGERTLKAYALRILALADQISDQAQIGIDGLPAEVQDSIRAAFEIYMAIGPTLRRNPGFPLRTKVPKHIQQWIALRCIYGFHNTMAHALKESFKRLIYNRVPTLGRLPAHVSNQKRA